MNQTHFAPPSFNWGDSFHVKRRKEEESFSSLFEHSVDKWMDGWGRRRKTILVAFILGTFIVFVIEMTTFNELVKSMNLCKKQSIFCRKCELIFLWQKTSPLLFSSFFDMRELQFRERMHVVQKVGLNQKPKS